MSYQIFFRKRSERGSVMTMITLTYWQKAPIIILSLVVMAGVAGCTKNNSDDPAVEPSHNAAIEDDGRLIVFPQGSRGLCQISSSTVKKGIALISVIAPARVVASISRGGSSGDRIILFESAEATSLYSQYRQARANVLMTANNLDRAQQLYENQGATAKDLNQAQNDAANARASMAEMEGRLRVLGFDPAKLEADSSNKAWLISDVAETQLHEVQKGEEVDVMFASFPGKKFIGHADAIGDIVDPATRTVKVRVTIPNPSGRFLPGMFAQVDFGDPTSGVVILPLSAVVTVDGQDYVFVEAPEREFHRRKIALATSTNSAAIVLAGLDDGDRVVNQGAMLLKGLSFGY